MASTSGSMPLAGRGGTTGMVEVLEGDIGFSRALWRKESKVVLHPTAMENMRDRNNDDDNQMLLGGLMQGSNADGDGSLVLVNGHGADTVGFQPPMNPGMGASRVNSIGRWADVEGDELEDGFDDGNEDGVPRIANNELGDDEVKPVVTFRTVDDSLVLDQDGEKGNVCR
ncbi:hypothetical protein NE237_009323 [Protea cynaroides]|uniref:Uncharacterized protein n=1 Tax=Protea cynaroides TaxID=273540 RepID=A0A9Q0KXB9_9MAGN|nr:hypothetical protein NE237_009323 [Protea cynaroides]